jgi:hypothetical protein
MSFLKITGSSSCIQMAVIEYKNLSRPGERCVDRLVCFFLSITITEMVNVTLWSKVKGKYSISTVSNTIHLKRKIVKSRNKNTIFSYCVWLGI